MRLQRQCAELALDRAVDGKMQQHGQPTERAVSERALDSTSDHIVERFGR